MDTKQKYTIILDNDKRDYPDRTIGVDGKPGINHLKKRKKLDVHTDRNDIASKIDKDGDFRIDLNDIKDYLKKEDILRDSSNYDVDEQKIVKDFMAVLQKKPPAYLQGYHSYEQLITELKDLETKYPDLAKTVSIGKTAEGRDIMALKISKGAGGDTGDKTGFVITGCHHAREWMSMEAPLYMAKELVQNYDKDENVKKRLDNSEIWVIPMVNPDGYEYSRNEYGMWRKNRAPIHATDIPKEIASQMKADKNGVVAYGVDPNRNYYDNNPAHKEFYRPPGDTPESTYDDFGFATSDDPRQETYRGPKGASEKEVQAMINLWMNHKNIKGIVNHHNYGNKILFPWGVTQKESPNKKLYTEIMNKMTSAATDYTAEQSGAFYPASGDPDDFASLNDKISFTIEIGDSFQPDTSDIIPISKEVYNANMAFLDYLIDHSQKGDKKSELSLDTTIPKDLFST